MDYLSASQENMPQYAYEKRRRERIRRRRLRCVRKRIRMSLLIAGTSLFMILISFWGNRSTSAAVGSAQPSAGSAEDIAESPGSSAEDIAGGQGGHAAEDSGKEQIEVVSEDWTPLEPSVGKPLPETDSGGGAVRAQFDYSQPVPLTDAVDISYFDDAVFIGDSRMEGFITNTGLSEVTSYTYKGLTVDMVLTHPVINMDGARVSIIDALKKTEFTKVYLMMGLNETGWTYSSVFVKNYQKVIDEIKAINPEAVIYVQSVFPISAGVSAKHSYIKNEKIYEYNALLRTMAEENEIFFLNVAEEVALPDGSLPEEAATDGIHFIKEYCGKWLSYLQTHTVK